MLGCSILTRFVSNISKCLHNILKRHCINKSNIFNINLTCHLKAYEIKQWYHILGVLLTYAYTPYYSFLQRNCKSWTSSVLSSVCIAYSWERECIVACCKTEGKKREHIVSLHLITTNKTSQCCCTGSDSAKAPSFTIGSSHPMVR